MERHLDSLCQQIHSQDKETKTKRGKLCPLEITAIALIVGKGLFKHTTPTIPAKDMIIINVKNVEFVYISVQFIRYSIQHK